jgi:AcrR family transcriptional regulator
MGIKERKEREKRHRRNAILRAAKKLIGESGVDGMSMNQLAELTELNKATLYSYFRNKDDLIDAIVYDGLILLEKKLKKSDREPAPGLAKVLNLTSVTFDFYREYPDYFHAMNHRERRSEGEERETPFSVKGNEVAERIFRKIREKIEQGMADGTVRPGIDINQLSILFFAITHGVIHTILSKDDVYSEVLGLESDEVERSALEFLEYYLKGKDKP